MGRPNGSPLQMNMHTKNWRYFWIFFGLAALLISGCQPRTESGAPLQAEAAPEAAAQSKIPSPTPFPTRPGYAPGELVAYTAQTGDSLPVLAVRFNSTVEEILAANDFIPADATTMPPGMPMQIPIYFEPFWGSPYQILPDSLFVNGPAQVGFDIEAFVESQPGWLKTYTEYAAGANRSGAEIVAYVAQNFSVGPRLLLALLDFQIGALSQGELPPTVDSAYLLGNESRDHRGLYLQLVWAANLFNNGYYGWRTGRLTQLDLQDGTVEVPDPWQNAATVTLQNYFSQNLEVDDYRRATGPDGFAQVYQNLFGDPWAEVQPHLPGSLVQPEMRLPFEDGKTWAFTGGPHTGWGTGDPWAAVDFAPPAVVGGCTPTNEWATAVADGVVARTDVGILELDLDSDGDVRTGWVVLYLHIAKSGRVAQGTAVTTGQLLGHPSCEGGTSTGTHIHIARKYNGEWIPAEGVLPFNLEGWISHSGGSPYRGTLTRFSQNVVASASSTQASYITAGE